MVFLDNGNIVRATIVFAFLFTITFSGCTKTELVPEEEYAGYHDFTSYADFINSLEELAIIQSADKRELLVDEFWDSLATNKQVPFIMNDSVAFLYKKDSDDVVWAGDFNGWGYASAWIGVKVGLSDINIYEAVFPSDARLEYKIIDNGRWLLDPANDYTQHGGFGANSELRMPDWVYPEEAIRREGVTPGFLSDNIIIQSANLGYKVQYMVYTPYNYNTETNLPVIYVTDGQDYSEDKFGSMTIVLDNLIFDGVIKPVIAVFIDPRNPDNTSENRRAEEYRSNIKFADFVADELATAIDNQYKTSSNADDRAILGASFGGWNSSYFGLARNDKFHLIGIHSPSTSNEIIQGYENSSGLPIKVFMSTGVFYDTEYQARALKAVLETKGYPLSYIEVNQGHSWGNWREMLKPTLTYFFEAGN